MQNPFFHMSAKLMFPEIRRLDKLYAACTLTTDLSGFPRFFHTIKGSSKKQGIKTKKSPIFFSSRKFPWTLSVRLLRCKQVPVFTFCYFIIIS